MQAGHLNAYSIAMPLRNRADSNGTVALFLSRFLSCKRAVIASFTMSVGHYENFPVASWLMPSSLRPAVRAIYRFARTADDLADEGDAPPAERLAALDELREQLEAMEAATTFAVAGSRRRDPPAPPADGSFL